MGSPAAAGPAPGIPHFAAGLCSRAAFAALTRPRRTATFLLSLAAGSLSSSSRCATRNRASCENLRASVISRFSAGVHCRSALVRRSQANGKLPAHLGFTAAKRLKRAEWLRGTDPVIDASTAGRRVLSLAPSCAAASLSSAVAGPTTVEHSQSLLIRRQRTYQTISPHPPTLILLGTVPPCRGGVEIAVLDRGGPS